MGKGIVQKKQRLFVIFSDMQQHKKLGTHYTSDAAGRQRRIRSKAAKSLPLQDAQAFAERNHITLNAHTYIGQEDFTDFDLRGNPPA